MSDQEESNQENLSEYFTCPICLDILNYPVMISCGHLTCFSCLQHTNENSENISCPVCQCPIKPKEVKAAFIGKQVGEDTRGDIVKGFEDADKLRKERAAQNVQNQGNFRFQLGMGGLGLMGGIPGLNININGFPGGVRINQGPQVPAEPLTFKQKLNKFTKKVGAIALFGLVIYLQIKESVNEFKVGGQKVVYYHFP
ncbi:Zinc finger, C3HC4 type (RING finger) domain-containing protein [Spironucleus salmonicida]|uniref:Zinc finger, C3HC4 type (RING finger) domain-containing protein n=1 Tax=Spironucleus salmonicida TaxID=348837 RepID=V6LTK6_9EUKA|nr:Zinc finger, C3HC4 type (RING finger) domain-containing protein [Spironucleus salmonicida]|eukprot:EST47583.1 Zinc finger, C3HC4 type (RING finger) domain-containing protein [Spironucleus salmonicida]